MAKSYLERKEAWALRMKERGLGAVVPRSDARLPPGQHEVKHLPVLDLGEHPRVGSDRWRLELSGHVEQPTALTWEALQQLPRRTVKADFHCVTTWSHFDCTWEGVALETLIDLARPHGDALYVHFTGYDGYTTNTDLEPLLAEDALLATHFNGQPLTLEHGAPARIIVPRLYAWKGAKFVRSMEFLNEERLGYWEQRGYSNSADPWTNDRFAHTDAFY